MKKGIGVVVVLLIAAGVFYFVSRGKKEPGETGSEPATSAVTTSNEVIQKPATASSISNSMPTASNAFAVVESNVAERAGAVPPPPPAPDLPAANVVENVSHAIHQYSAMFGGNPVGVNEEIAKALNGGNPKGVNFIDAQAGMRLNAHGELVDPWDTPLFFHQLSATDMEVRSAGPDKKMWTADDVVSR